MRAFIQFRRRSFAAMVIVAGLWRSAAAIAEPASVALTGETSNAEIPQAMTDSWGPGVFITLTRTAMSQEKLPANAEVLTARQIRQAGAQTAGDAISTLTSVRVNHQGQLGSTQLAGIRGATSNQTLVLIDGRPVGGVGLSASQDLSEIPVTQIDRIEVVRGGVSALYGPNAVGGVINVITKRASQRGLPISHVAWEGRSYKGLTQRLDVGSRYGPVDFFFFGNRARESGFRLNQYARTHNIGGNVGVAMGKAGKLLLDGAAYHAEAGVPGQLFPDIPVNQYDHKRERQAKQTPYASQETDTTYARTSWMLPLPMDSLLTTRLFGSKRQVEYRQPVDPYKSQSDRHEHSNGAEGQLQMPLGILIGGSFIHDRLDNRDVVTSTNSFNQHVENWGIFAQETFTWRALTLIPSFRYDKNSLAGDSNSPRAQAIIEATSWLRLSGSIARSFRAPTLDDLFYPFTDFGYGLSYQGNLNLRPEKAWTQDAGFELHGGSSSVKVSYFRANVRNLLQTTTDLASTTTNVGRARRQGMEVEARKSWRPWLNQTLNYTYLSNRGIPVGFTDYVDLQLSPRHTVNTRARLNLWRATVDNTVRYVSSYYEGNNRGGAKISDYCTWDVRIGYPIRQMELYVGVNDVTDKRYRERSGYPLPGRTVYGGFELRLWG